MAVLLETKETTLVAVLSGEIDHHCARPMRVEIDEMIEQVQPTVLILDLAV